MKNTKRKPERVSEMEAQPGTRNRTNAFIRARRELKEAVRLDDFFNGLHGLLQTPEYKTFVATKFDQKTGKAIQGKYKIDKSSVPLYFYFDEQFESDYPNISKEVKSALVEILPKRGAHIMRVANDGMLLFEYRSVQIGGGHNDLPSYTIKIAATVVRSTSTVEQFS